MLRSVFLIILLIYQESQPTQSQMEFTQLTQTCLTQPDESSNMTPTQSSCHTPLSPPKIIPYGRLVPCVPTAKLAAIELMPTQESYWLGRSHKCDVTAQYLINDDIPKKELSALEWAKSMISNRHCRIFQQSNGNKIFIEDNSGNGTFVNQQTLLRKGEARILHSGDEICLVNMFTIRSKIKSHRVNEMIRQQFSFILVQSNSRKAIVNPRAMNYHFARNYNNSRSNEKQTPSEPEIPAAERIETFYDMRELLGDGTSGQVRRAIHRQSGEERAVKIISLRGQRNTAIMEREVNLLKSIDHPYIVRLVEVFVRPGVAMYLVMELVKGGDLFDSIVEKQRYTVVEARRAMRRILSAVDYLHNESNIVHRDLKPENILCSSPTHVKLADFGLAKIVKADGLKTFCGTPAYFAPEVLQRRQTVAGEGRYGKPADIWSLGVILYILLTGKPPFDPDMEESSKAFEVPYESDSHIWSTMPSAKDLVQNMLCLDARQRYTVRQACDHPWINEDDGDTHRHPFDDPAVGTKKSTPKQESKADDSDSTDTGTCVAVQDDSTCSKLSRSKDGSRSAPSHGQSESIFRVDNKKALEAKNFGIKIPPLLSEDKTKANEETSSEKDSEDEDSDGDKSNQNKNENSDSDSPSSSDRPSEQSRSPLTNLNFNKRSNDFRNRIIQETKPCLSPSNESEQLESPNVKGERQVAVTPHSSNAKAGRDQSDPDTNEDEDEEKDEDPILSQFSSVISSVESFGDSSVNDISKPEQPCSESKESKRALSEDKADPQAKSPKRAKISPKQTTLSSWLVKKN